MKIQPKKIGVMISGCTLYALLFVKICTFLDPSMEDPPKINSKVFRHEELEFALNHKASFKFGNGKVGNNLNSQ